MKQELQDEAKLSNWPLQCSHLKDWYFLCTADIRKVREKTFDDATKNIQKSHTSFEAPKFEHTQKVIRYYIKMLIKFSRDKRLRSVIQETACTFFNRFFLRRSILEFDPRTVMFTCVTVAIKVEEYSRDYSIGNLFGSIQGVDVQKIFELELVLCDALNFQLLVLHTREPLLALKGEALKLLKRKLSLNDTQLEHYSSLMDKIYEDAEADCIRMHETAEIPFLYPPARMAMAAFSHHALLTLKGIVEVPSLVRDVCGFSSHSMSEEWRQLNNENEAIMGMLNKSNMEDVDSPEFVEVVRTTMKLCMGSYDLK